MSLETVLLVVAWLATALMLIIFVPKDKFREAQVIFFFQQLITWLLGLLVVQFGLIEYPVREFPNATNTSFAFEYFIYPSVCVIFNLYYPARKSVWRQLFHYVSYCSAITVVEVVVERYTNIINYINWSWYWTWGSLFLTFFISREYYVWFYKLNKKRHDDRHA